MIRPALVSKQLSSSRPIHQRTVCSWRWLGYSSNQVCHRQAQLAFALPLHVLALLRVFMC
jgi:hypothetical protein